MIVYLFVAICSTSLGFLVASILRAGKVSSLLARIDQLERERTRPHPAALLAEAPHDAATTVPRAA